jgi:hypothetical protein
MDIGERFNRVVTWCLTCLLVVPVCTVLMRVLRNTKDTWQKIADRLMEKIAELARPAAGS